MKKSIKLVTAMILLVVGMMLVIPTYAATKSSITVNSNIDGNKFFKMIKNTKGDKDIYVKIKNTAELANFADELYYTSNISYDYEVETPETEHTLKNGKVKLLYSTADIKEMETGKLVFDPDSDTGKDFLKALHKSKADSKIRLRIAADNKKYALKQLKKFQKEVKSASEFGLSYEIYTVENVKQLDRCQGAAIYIDLEDRTKDILACEKMVASIKGWKNMSENQRFLALSKLCNKNSKWYNQQWNDFHFYKKDNKLVCYDYAYMYKRVAEMITDKARTEVVLNANAKHALAIIGIGNNYYEGNNGHLNKNYHWKGNDIRSWYKSNPKKYGSKLVRDFIKANGK